DNQRVAVPFGDRVTQPCRSRIFRKLAAISEDLPEDRLHFIQHQEFSRSLNQLKWFRQQIAVGYAIRHTPEVGPNHSRLRVLLKHLAAERCEWFFAGLEVRKDVPEIL